MTEILRIVSAFFGALFGFLLGFLLGYVLVNFYVDTYTPASEGTLGLYIAWLLIGLVGLVAGGAAGALLYPRRRR
jgi:ABC-type antimicrobial peptide transport system permease subunit